MSSDDTPVAIDTEQPPNDSGVMVMINGKSSFEKRTVPFTYSAALVLVSK